MRRFFLTLVCALVPVGAAAQEEVPSAEQVIARYVEAIGGADLIRSRTSMHMVGEFSMPAMGITGPMEVSVSGMKSLTVIDLEGVGRISVGFDGETAWEMNPFQGPRIKEGKELQQVLEDTGPESMLRDASLFTTRETVGKSEWAGEECWRVRLVWKSGRESFECYSIATGLLIGTETTAATSMGEVPTTITVQEYKDFDGIKFATKATQAAMGVEQQFTFTAVHFMDIDPKVFDLPPEIQALVKQ